MGYFDRLPKEEGNCCLTKQREIERFLGGIRHARIPDVVSRHTREQIAVKEEAQSYIPIVAMVDTNANPNDIDMFIPSNDDAIQTFV